MDVINIPVAKIALDVRNPRIGHAMEGMGGNDNQAWIRLALGQSASVDEAGGTSTTYSSLKASIRAYKGLINPIIVTTRPNGEYLVVEGNTRVAIFRELDEEGADGDWTHIPAVVRTASDETDEHAIRLQAHLVGPRPWYPYDKAKYLHDLYINKKLSINQILEFCGGVARKREIETYIAAYADMQQHYMPLAQEAGAAPEYRSFSSFVELQSIKPSIVKAGFNETDFAKWVLASKLSPQTTVRSLPRILANPEAKRQFLTHNAREAEKILAQPNPNAVIGSASLEQLAAALTVKIRQLSWRDVQMLIQTKEEEPAQAVLTCAEELRVLAQALEQTPDA